MRNQFLPMGLISAVLTSAAPVAQTKPDFSGTWTFDASRSPYFATSNPRVSVRAQPVLGEAFTVEASTTRVSPLRNLSRSRVT
jgi:hypothetical protein